MVELPRDCASLLGLKADEVAYMKMLKSAYGLADTPLLWFREASKRLERLGFRSTELDRCTFGFYDSQNNLQGMVNIHVDDLVIAGNQGCRSFVEAVKNLKEAFDFGKWDILTEQKKLTYCGGHIAMDYIKKILPLTIPKGRGSESALTTYEKTKARALLGALQWPGVQGVQALLASTSILANEIAVDKGEVTHRDVMTGVKCKYSVIAWKSFKLQRVVRSSLGAEAQVMAITAEEFYFTKLFLKMIRNPAMSIKECQDWLKEDKCAIVTDCKALYDTLKRANIQGTQDKRVAVECLVINQILKDAGAELPWVSSERQIADGLTKLSARQNFIEQLKGGYIQLIYDEDFKAAKKKTPTERRESMRQTTSAIAYATSAAVMSAGLQGCGDHREGDSEGIEMMMWLMTILVAIGLSTAIKWIYDGITSVWQRTTRNREEYKNTATHDQVVQTPTAWDELYKANEAATRWHHEHGEETELRLLADQQVRHLEQELEETTERFNEMTQRMLHFRTRSNCWNVNKTKRERLI